jgi:hypothetical protein
MATFSMGEAIGSGFGLIVRRPLSVLAWGLVYLVLLAIPLIAIFAALGTGFVSEMQALSAHTGASTSPADLAGIFHAQARMMQFQALFMLGVLPAQAVLQAAIFRSVLEPKDTAFASMRFGGREAWLLLLILAFEVMAYLIALASAVVFLLIGAGVAAVFLSVASLKAWVGPALIVVGVAWAVTFIWILLRLSLAGPMTFAEREFRLFESWKLTRGQGWKLFGLVLVLLVLFIAIVLALLLGFALLAGVAGIGAASVHAAVAQPGAAVPGMVIAWCVIAFFVLAFLEAAIAAIWYAPWATVYRSLSAGRSSPLALAGVEAGGEI